ncbi:hypothetical protein NC651_023491 [Populus alba x Populus x berolinensis]|nr:hypothetical protein NC651_023491 [Populus alba x Populus x berolinensis]
MQDVVVAAGGEPSIGRKQYMTRSRATATANTGQHAKTDGEGSGFAKSYFGYTEFLYVDLIFCQGSMFPLLLSVYCTLELIGLQLCFSLIVVTCRVVHAGSNVDPAYYRFFGLLQ